MTPTCLVPVGQHRACRCRLQHGPRCDRAVLNRTAMAAAIRAVAPVAEVVFGPGVYGRLGYVDVWLPPTTSEATLTAVHDELAGWPHWLLRGVRLAREDQDPRGWIWSRLARQEEPLPPAPLVGWALAPSSVAEAAHLFARALYEAGKGSDFARADVDRGGGRWTSLSGWCREWLVERTCPAVQALRSRGQPWNEEHLLAQI